MSKPFDMELFLAGVLTGTHTTRQRHLRQAKAIQTAIAERWQRDIPWTWQRKHLAWFLNHRKRTANTPLLRLSAVSAKESIHMCEVPPHEHWRWYRHLVGDPRALVKHHAPTIFVGFQNGATQ